MAKGEDVGKAIVYLVAIAIFILLLRATGLLDGLFSRGNLQERDAFWQQTVGAEVPPGSTQQTVEEIMARSGVSLECCASSLSPPVTECRGDDPGSKGGTSTH